MKRERMLGMFQLALLHLVDTAPKVDRYGDKFAPQVTKLFGHTVTPAQVYIALNRLRERGLVTSAAAPGTGRGHAREIYTMLPAGVEALENYRKVARFVLQEEDKSQL